MYALLLSVFVVLINETDGNDVHGGDTTACEKHKQHLIRATSSGFLDFEEQFNAIIAAVETEDEARQLIEEEFDLQLSGLDDYNNPFQSWLPIKEGTGINSMYLPSLVPLIIKCIKLLPLWSGLMIPVFSYGSETASSAAVESSFNKIKNTTFKHISLPTDLEIFLEHHITSLRGSSLLRSCQQPISSLDRIDETVIPNEPYQTYDIHEADKLNHTGDDIQHINQLIHEDDLNHTDEV